MSFFVKALTIDLSSGFPITLTIDFGTGCTATNTNTGGTVTRKGKVTCVFSGLYKDVGSTITVTLDNKGSISGNVNFAKKRYKSVANYLAKKGLDKNIIELDMDSNLTDNKPRNMTFYPKKHSND